MTMVVIGFDRYNVIVKGFSGTKITGAKAAGILLILWTYAIVGCCPPFLGWGGYALGKYSFLLRIYFLALFEPSTKPSYLTIARLLTQNIQVVSYPNTD